MFLESEGYQFDKRREQNIHSNLVMPISQMDRLRPTKASMIIAGVQKMKATTFPVLRSNSQVLRHGGMTVTNPVMFSYWCGQSS
jgi:hypothetical protein